MNEEARAIDRFTLAMWDFIDSEIVFFASMHECYPSPQVLRWLLEGWLLPW